MAQERADVLERFLSENQHRLSGMVSVEWIGKKFQQTPGIQEDVTVVAHSDMNIEHFDVQIDRKFEKLEEIFDTLIIEARFLNYWKLLRFFLIISNYTHINYMILTYIKQILLKITLSSYLGLNLPHI